VFLGCLIVIFNLYRLNNQLAEIIRYNDSVELRNKKFDDVLKKLNGNVVEEGIEEALRQEELRNKK
jgi:hypothetical protein